MLWNHLTPRRRQGRASRRPLHPACEPLETRAVMSATHGLAPIGQIAGQIVNETTGQGVNHVQVDLINTRGRVIHRTLTNSQGLYLFNVLEQGPYVVREHVPKGDVQVAPTFVNTAPSGSYSPGAGNSSWNYGGNSNPALGPVGPAYWSDIAPAGKLPFESPIDLHGPTVDLSKLLTIHYTDVAPTQIVNNSHQIQIQFPSTSTDSITVAGQTFNLAQFHYHSPGEHTVNGHRYALEQHFVNVSPRGGDTVVTDFFNLGAHNSALDPILNAALTALTTPNSKTKISAPILFEQLLPKNTQGWFYEGSLTTPPLSQPVNWFIYKTPITLDLSQLAEFRALAAMSGFFPNNRPIQTTDGRLLNEVDAQINFTNQTFVAANFGLASA